MLIILVMRLVLFMRYAITKKNRKGNYSLCCAEDPLDMMRKR